MNFSHKPGGVVTVSLLQSAFEMLEMLWMEL